MKLGIYLLIGVSSLLLTACKTSQPLPEQAMAQQVESLLQSRMEESNISGLAAGVVYNGRILSARGYGYADGEQQTQAVTPDVRFQIGSTSKLFTALAVMQLVESGQLLLDEDIRTYLPGFNPNALSSEDLEVTVRDLLTHHSGIPSAFLKSFVLSEPDPDLFMETSAWLSDTYLVWPNQTVFAYCNICYSLMGELVAKVSQQSYESYIQNHIFRPLDLADSQVYGLPGIDPNVSGGFTAGQPVDPLIVKDVPAGGYIMSARDMAKFAQALVQTAQGERSGWIEPRTLQAMFEPQYEGLPMNADFSMGLGFWLSDHNGHRVVGHGGTVPPFYSELKVIPQSKAAVFIASNDNMGNNAVLEQLVNDVFDILLSENADTEDHQAQARPFTTPIADGDYNLGGLGLLTVTTVEGERYIELPGVGSVPVQDQNGVLQAPDMNLELRPYDHPLIRFHGYFGKYLLGPATEVEQTSESNAYDPWLGAYRSDDVVENGKLYYDTTLGAYRLEVDIGALDEQIALVLKPVGPQLMQVQGYGRNLGNVIRLGMKDDHPVLYFSGIELVGVEAE